MREKDCQRFRFTGKAFGLDAISLGILATIQRHGRIGIRDLAAAVGLSPSPCLRRLRRLEADGYITGYSADLNPARLGDPQVIFALVTLGSHTLDAFLRFEKALAGLDEVLEVHLVGGSCDYLVKVVTGGIAEYQDLMERLLAADLGIIRFASHIALRTPLARKAHPFWRMRD